MDIDTSNLLINTDKDNNLRSLKKSSGKFGIFALAFVLLRFVASLIGRFVSETDFYSNLDSTQSLILDFIISDIFLYIIPLILCLFIFPSLSFKRKNAKYPGSEYTVTQALFKFPSAYALSTLFNFLTIGIIYFISKLLDSSIPNNYTNEAVQGISSNYFVGIITAALLPAIFEEIIFRGALLGAMRPFGDKLAVVLSALFFGLAHGNIFQFTYTFILGLFLGYIFIRTNSLKSTMIYHFLVNGASVTLQFLTLKGFTFMSNKELNTGKNPGGAYFVLMVSMVIVTYAIILIGIIQLFKMSVLYIGKKIHKTQISYLNNDFYGISEAKKYLIFFTRPSVIISIILYIVIIAMAIVL